MEPKAIEHGYMVALDPPGRENRRWRCEHCGDEGPLSDLVRRTCSAARVATDADLIDPSSPRTGGRSRW